MRYLNFSAIRQMLDQAEAYSALALENGCSRGKAETILANAGLCVEKALADFRTLEDASAKSDLEPNDYLTIQKKCEGGNTAQEVEAFEEKLAGALLGRFAGCTLGVPVEGWEISHMKNMAESCGMAFPPEDYWTSVERPWDIQYGVDRRNLYTASEMDGVPVDDDITYVILSLLMMEKYGKNLTTEDVGEYWKKHLSCACTAEWAALENLKNGVPAACAAQNNNPYAQWIGALIRADGFGYACAGDPHSAAKMAYQDAYLSHRRNGIYGEMLFAAAIAAAFTVTDPLEAIRIGLREIPATSDLYRDVQWALDTAPEVNDYLAARKLVDERFPGMHFVHTNNNACLIVFALHLGNKDFSRTISNAVAMGLDNDCTAATCGSIAGAIAGRAGIAEHWTARFNNRLRTYIAGAEELSITDVLERFTKLYRKFQNCGDQASVSDPLKKKESMPA